VLLHYCDGHWDFPKGKIEPGETEQEAAQRELHEETGLTAQLDDTFKQSVSYIFLDQQKKLTTKTVYFFVGKAMNSDVQLSDEHTNFQWLTYQQALERLTYDNAKNILKKAHKHLLSLRDTL
jgi:bis(5'-nucleosidyl)-tetraphosphatase